MADSHELQLTEERNIELYRGAVMSVVGEVSYNLGIAFDEVQDNIRVLWAEGGLAQDKPADRRTSREVTLVRMRQVVPSLRKAIDGGLVQQPEDANDLSAVLMNYDASPIQALTYLTGTSRSLVREIKTPRELINGLMIHQDMLEGSLNPLECDAPTPTLATVFRAADNAGIDLANPYPDEEAEAAIASTIQAYSFRKDVARSDEDGVPFHTSHKVTGSTIGTTPVGFATLNADEQVPDPELEEFFLFEDDPKDVVDSNY